MSEDETIEAMCNAAWEVRREWSARRDFPLPPWNQTEPKDGEPWHEFCDAECYKQAREEMQASMKAALEVMKLSLAWKKAL